MIRPFTVPAAPITFFSHKYRTLQGWDFEMELSRRIPDLLKEREILG